MKKNLIITSVILGMATTAVLFTGCSKPTERPSVVNSKISANLVELKDLGEITSEAKVVYSLGGDKEISGYAGSLKQAKLEGKVADLIKKIKTPGNKKAIDDQLKSGAIAIVVLDDQIKVLKVTSQTANTLDTQVTSLTYLSKVKALCKTSEAAAQATIQSEIATIRYKSPAELNETFGLVEVTSLKIEHHGNLDNEKTDYNEKKSTLNVVDRPFEVSTHIVVGEEIGSEAEAAAAKAALEAESASAK